MIKPRCWQMAGNICGVCLGMETCVVWVKRSETLTVLCHQQTGSINSGRLSSSDKSILAAAQTKNKKGLHFCKPFLLLVRPERFERPTPWFVAKYSIQLSYGRLRDELYRRFVQGTMAEREGFEPSVGDKPYAPLAGEYLRPLGHLSVFYGGGRIPAYPAPVKPWLAPDRG